MSTKKHVAKGRSSTSIMEPRNKKMDIKNIMKDIELLGSSHMTWKERKELENRKVVSLGGKPVKKQRLPLSVARVTMKKQKEREEKMLKESLILGRFGGFSSSRKRTEKRKPEEKVLMASEGRFKNGVLDVKHLLQPAEVSTAREGHNGGYRGVNTGKKKKGRGKMNKGKKGGDRKRH